MGNLNINTSTNTIEAGTSGGIRLEPGSTDVVTIGKGVLLPDGTKSEPAVRFSDDNNTGLYSPVNNTVALTGNGQDVMQLIGVASAANYLKLTNSVSGNALLIEADGTDLNTSVNILPKGTGTVNISGLAYPTNDGTSGQLLTTDGSGNLSFTTVSTGDPDQNLFATVAGDTGSTTADLTTDTLTIAGGTDITTTVAGDTVTIDFSGSAGGGATGYLYTDTPATDPSGTGAGTLVIGDGANAFTVNDSIVIGNGSTSENDNQIVIGNNTSGSNSFQGVVIGDNASIVGTGPVAIGEGAAVTSQLGVAIGVGTSAGQGAFAAGHSSKATGIGSISIGSNEFTAGDTTASGGQAIAIGKGTQTTGLNAVGIGFRAEATADRAIAIGVLADATSESSIAIGEFAVAPTRGMQLKWNYRGTFGPASLDGQPRGEVSLTGDKAQWVMPSYTVASLPGGTTGGMIFVTDEVGGSIPAFYDGTNWRRVSDRAIVS